MIDEKSRLAEHLHELNRMVRFATEVAVVATRRSGDLADYYRIHDAQLNEPTGAVAFAHWSRKVDFALTWSEVPMGLRAAGAKKLAYGAYAVSIKVVDESTRRAAEELLTSRAHLASRRTLNRRQRTS